MRLLFVVPGGGRLAPEIGAWCREFLTRLAGRDHDIEVLTTEGGVFRGGLGELGGIALHRLPVGRSYADLVEAGQADQADQADQVEQVEQVEQEELAELAELAELVGACIEAGSTPPLDLQEAWLSGLGPPAAGLVAWLGERGRDFDAVAFVDAASQAAWSGLPALTGVVPTVLHPLAADDARFRLGVFDSVLRRPTALGFVDRAEERLVRPRAGRRPTAAVVGCGYDGGVGDFRSQEVQNPSHPVAEAPYCVVGRGSRAGRDQVLRYSVAYQRRHRAAVQMMWAEDLTDRGARVDAMRGAVAVIEPRGIDPLPVLWAEAGACRRPCLVATGRRGALRPRPGALGFGDFVEFEAALELLAEGGVPGAGAGLGDEGWQFVALHCRWDDLLARYERLLHVIQSRR